MPSPVNATRACVPKAGCMNCRWLIRPFDRRIGCPENRGHSGLLTGDRRESSMENDPLVVEAAEAQRDRTRMHPVFGHSAGFLLAAGRSVERLYWWTRWP